MDIKPLDVKKRTVISIVLDQVKGSGVDNLQFTGPLKKNRLSWYRVKSGMGILTASLLGVGPVEFQLITSSPCLIIIYPVSQETKPHLSPGTVSKPSGEDSGKQKIYTFFGKTACLDLYATASPLFLTALLLGRKRLMALCGDTLLTALPPLDAVIAGKSEGFVSSRPLDAAARLELHQMLFLRPRIFGEKVYHERAALRLAVHEIERLVRPRHNSAYGKELMQPGDYKRLIKARSILISRMVSPPDNRTLARWVGMNENKLKLGFKQMFGDSPKAFLRRHRMEAARKMLQAGGMSVTRVALEVGYSNPSAFAACFSKHFGCKPSLMKA